MSRFQTDTSESSFHLTVVLRSMLINLKPGTHYTRIYDPYVRVVCTGLKPRARFHNSTQRNATNARQRNATQFRRASFRVS